MVGEMKGYMLLLLVPLILYLYAYFRTPLLPLIDGPYYSAQVSWIARYWTLRHPDPPLTFYLLLPFYFATGDNILAVKVGVPVISSLMFIPAFLYFREVDGDDEAAALGALALTTSYYTVRLVTDFVKNAFGFIWVFSWLFFAIRYERRGKLRDLVGATASVLLVMLTHILDFGFTVGLSILYALLRRDRRAAILASISSIFLALAFLQPWIVGGDVSKGVALVEQVAEGDVGPSGLLDVVPLAASLLLLLSWYKSGEHIHGSLGLVSLLFSLPVYGRGWVMRFRNLGGIPLSAVLSRGKAEAGGGRILAALALVLIASSGFALASTVRPTIDVGTFNEMKYILDRYSSSVFVPDVKIRYWAETISFNVTSTPEGAGYMLICQPRQGPVHPGSQPKGPSPLTSNVEALVRRLRAQPVFQGERCVLFKIGGR